MTKSDFDSYHNAYSTIREYYLAQLISTKNAIQTVASQVVKTLTTTNFSVAIAYPTIAQLFPLRLPVDNALLPSAVAFVGALLGLMTNYLVYLSYINLSVIPQLELRKELFQLAAAFKLENPEFNAEYTDEEINKLNFRQNRFFVLTNAVGFGSALCLAGSVMLFVYLIYSADLTIAPETGELDRTTSSPAQSQTTVLPRQSPRQ